MAAIVKSGRKFSFGPIERWSDYLSAVDPTSAGQSVVDEPVPFDEVCTPQDDDPPVLDHESLLRLFQGSGDCGKERTPHETHAASPRGRQSRYESTPRACADQSRSALGLAIPPLPTQLDLDDEIREAFLADATDLFERIERIVVGLSSQDDERDAVHELRRCFHTLKGAAGSVGLNELAMLVHELEDPLGLAGGDVSPELNDLLHQVVNYLDGLIGLLRRGPATFRPSTPLPASRPDATRPSAAFPPDRSASPARTITQSIATSPIPTAEGPIRVPAARFDELTDLVSELIVQGRFWLSQAESMKTFAATVQICRNRLLGSLDRLYDVGLGQKGGRRLGALFDPQADLPEQLRRLAEQADDLAVLAASAQAHAAPMADRGDTLVRLSLQAWDSFQSLRIVPIRGLFMRLAARSMMRRGSKGGRSRSS